MNSKNSLKRRVLECVQVCREGSSREVADRLGIVSTSGRKKVSMTLLKCKRQGLLDRFAAKKGRARMFCYVCTERGCGRMAYYKRMDGERTVVGLVDVEAVVQKAKKEVDKSTWLWALTVKSAVGICESTDQENVFHAARDIALYSSIPIDEKERLVATSAAAELLNRVSPHAYAKIQALAKQVTEDFYSTFEFWQTHLALDRLHGFHPLNSFRSDSPFLLLATKRIRELHAELALLYYAFTKEKREKESYMRLYESEKNRRKELENLSLRLQPPRYVSKTYELHDCAVCINAGNAFVSLCEVCRSAWQLALKTDREIIGFLSRRLHQSSNVVLWTAYMLMRSEEKRAKLESDLELLEALPGTVFVGFYLGARYFLFHLPEVPLSPQQPLVMQHNTLLGPVDMKTEDSHNKPWTEEDLEDFHSRWWQQLPSHT